MKNSAKKLMLAISLSVLSINAFAEDGQITLACSNGDLHLKLTVDKNGPHLSNGTLVVMDSPTAPYSEGAIPIRGELARLKSDSFARELVGSSHYAFINRNHRFEILNLQASSPKIKGMGPIDTREYQVRLTAAQLNQSGSIMVPISISNANQTMVTYINVFTCMKQ